MPSSLQALIGVVSLVVGHSGGSAHDGASTSYILPQSLRRKAQDEIIPLGPYPRIINGVEALPFRYPYMVILSEGHVLKCAGSLIAPDVVLTAAHCSESFHEVQVGRYNRTDETEKYESLIVEDIFTHPSYFRNQFLDADPYDFAIVKLFGQSRIGRPVKINTERNLPQAGQQLTVFGWGSTDAYDMSQQSDVLRETDADYIPNDICKTFVGSYRGQEIDFEQVVIDVTLCAMDFVNMTDSCRGDSGGGLIIKGESAEDDLLVGLVSAGFGCANPTLPALYARVSMVYSWIHDMVCEYSENPPLEFGCSDNAAALPCADLPIGRDFGNMSTNTSGSGSTSRYQGVQYIPCTVLQPFTNITVKLRLDTRPEETGWILRNKDEQGVWRTALQRPVFFYSDVEPSSTVIDTVSVSNNREYEIILLDSFGDLSLLPSMPIEITDQNGQVLLSVDSLSGSDMYHASFGFTVGVPATISPTESMAPSATMTPTSSPTDLRPFISIIIQFDSFPQNIGFRLETLDGSVQGNTSEGQNTDDYTLLHVVYPGTFAPDLKDSRIKLEIPLMKESAKEQTYRLTMTSNEGYGFLSGGYEVWLGPVVTGDYLFRGGDFYYEEAHTILIEPNVSTSDIPSPSTVTVITNAPSLTPERPTPQADGDFSLTASPSCASSATVTTYLYVLVSSLYLLVQ